MMEIDPGRAINPQTGSNSNSNSNEMRTSDTDTTTTTNNTNRRTTESESRSRSALPVASGIPPTNKNPTTTTTIANTSEQPEGANGPAVTSASASVVVSPLPTSRKRKTTTGSASASASVGVGVGVRVRLSNSNSNSTHASAAGWPSGGAFNSPILVDRRSMPTEFPSQSYSHSQSQSQSQWANQAIQFGEHPFRWYNSRDLDTPFEFLYTQTNRLHPSTAAYLERRTTGKPSFRSQPGSNATNSPCCSSSSFFFSNDWGCDCPGGNCDPSRCACAQHARNQYSKSSRLTSQAQPQSLCECWIYCTCHQTNGNELTTESDQPRTIPSESALSQTATSVKSTILPHFTDGAVSVSVSALEVAQTVTVDHRTETSSAPDILTFLPPVSTSSNSVRIVGPPSPINRLEGEAIGSASFHSPLPLSARAVPRSHCFNRVVQRGPIAPGLELVVFKTRSKGWGVKTLTRIPKFSFVCEYIGEVIHEHVSEQRGIKYRKGHHPGNYLFSPEVAPTTSHLASSLNEEEGYDVDRECFTIDSHRIGHIARFLNHSCTPNLLSTNVYIEHRADLLCPRVAFFANQTIEAGEELTFYYGYKEAMEAEFVCRCQQCNAESRARVAARPPKKKPKLLDEFLVSVPLASRDGPPLSHLSTASNSSLTSLPLPTTDRLAPTPLSYESDALSAIPIPEFAAIVDSSAPPPSRVELTDPSHIYYRTRGINATTSVHSSRAAATRCASIRTRDVLSIDKEYLSALDQLVGVGRCIPIESTCCAIHIHRTRMALAVSALQQRFPNAWNADWHQRQLALMQQTKSSEYDREMRAKWIGLEREGGASTSHTSSMSVSCSNSFLRPSSSSSSSAPASASAIFFRCGICSLHFPSRNRLCAHRHAHIPIFKCQQCQEPFHTAAMLEWHQAGPTRQATKTNRNAMNALDEQLHHQTKQYAESPCTRMSALDGSAVSCPSGASSRLSLAPAASPLILPSLQFDQTIVRIVGVRTSRSETSKSSHTDGSGSDVVGTVSALPVSIGITSNPAVVPSSSSNLIRLVFAADMAKLLQLPSLTHYAFVRSPRIANDPSSAFEFASVRPTMPSDS